ncbi:M28 family peptidase [Haloferula rosea]|uniref:M28 family peptidase n=1 Tax=Haloferula rosea TaxID=490093 RepID=A0A934RAZ9_9BACT|nr:M28 family peptidase [Haloferula rosea]MBK1826029.1 M28 family peptidase [Haloferula rosea]
MRWFPILAAAAVLFTACSKDESSGEIPRLPLKPIDPGLAAEFDGQRAFAHVETLVGFGPRPPASEGFAKQLDYLEKQLADAGWTTRRQSFRAATPDGPVDFTNLIARHQSAPAFPESLPVIIGGHIDTKKLPFEFVGANDAGSSTGILLEFARVLDSDPASAAQIELLFFDGEEAFRPNITATDGLYGSKYFAHELSRRPSWPSLGIVLDIVGDPDFPLYYNPEAPAEIVSAVEKMAPDLGFKSSLTMAPGSIIDDHVPLMATGLPCFHLIGDFQSMGYWHQAGDTLDKITPEMLGKVGKLTLQLLAEPNLQPSVAAP